MMPRENRSRTGSMASQGATSPVQGCAVYSLNIFSEALPSVSRRWGREAVVGPSSLGILLVLAPLSRRLLGPFGAPQTLQPIRSCFLSSQITGSHVSLTKLSRGDTGARALLQNLPNLFGHLPGLERPPSVGASGWLVSQKLTDRFALS